MCGVKIFIILVAFGQFLASTKGRSVGLENDSDPCFGNPCNGGVCRAKTQAEGYGYSCQCCEGFSGENCEIGCGDCEVQCPLWAQNGECEKNPGWMRVNCQKSCMVCSSACEDFHSSCPAWATLGKCTTNPLWMKPNCKLSCKQC
ncbi:hypothetical protein ACROYT_G030887 [Oculina patagonica]